MKSTKQNIFFGEVDEEIMSKSWAVLSSSLLQSLTVFACNPNTWEWLQAWAVSHIENTFTLLRQIIHIFGLKIFPDGQTERQNNLTSSSNPPFNLGCCHTDARKGQERKRFREDETKRWWNNLGTIESLWLDWLNRIINHTFRTHQLESYWSSS